MIKKTIINLGILISLFSFISPSQGNYSIEYHKSQVERLHLQRDKYEQLENDLTEEQKHICQVFLHFNEMRLVDANDLETIAVCKQLQHLIVKEIKESENKLSKVWIENRTLWRIFGVENPLFYTCFYIADICSNSKTIPLDNKITEIIKQGDLSEDYRIRKMAIDLLTENSKYKEAIDYCLKLISDIKEGKKSDFLPQYQYYLIETRILYQRYLFREAVKTQRLNMEDVVNIGPQLVKIDLVQYRIAKIEAEKLINEEPQYAERCANLFSADIIGDLEEVKKFADHLRQIVILQKKEDSINPSINAEN